ncbi:hypothetical protein SNE40_003917 [Patella caerulea]|uniref:TauD/TfdA-like domain-containing protein n=1 Tax=Patella caerulea TaxID=87958 RepID=A0AAN8Q0S6_PATCE
MEYRSNGQLGVEVRGIDLKETLPDNILEKIKKDVHEHKLLIFKNQGVITPERHLEISRWFGELDSKHKKHKRSPHPDILRVSNDSTEGWTGFSRTGFHIDGSFIEKPFRLCIFYMVSIPREGSTAFISLNGLLNQLTPEKRELWNSLHGIFRQYGYENIHPLVYPHPVTRQPTMCFNLGNMEEFIFDLGGKDERFLKNDETEDTLKDIDREIKQSKDLIYRHKWEEGDLIICDNRAVGHAATPETQYPVSQIGLRILHRTTIKGVNTPSKQI